MPDTPSTNEKPKAVWIVPEKGTSKGFPARELLHQELAFKAAFILACCLAAGALAAAVAYG